MKTLHRSLSLTAMVCERGAALEQFKQIVFSEGRVRAFNGLVALQAPSGLDKAESFVVNFDRLALALRAVAGEEFEVVLKPEFLVLKRGKLTVRIRKLSAESNYHAAIAPPPKAQRVAATGFLQALSAVAPFVSDDASRPWSVAALLRGGYLWATNNLALVRYPLSMPEGTEIKIPGQAVPLLLELNEVTWYSRQGNSVVLACPDGGLSFPEANGDWPDVATFFKGRPKKLPKADPELHEAARTVAKFADRFVALKDGALASGVETIESEYEVEVKGGKGSYNAKLLALVAEHATAIDFSSFPKPVHFQAGEMQGLMIGVAPPQEAA